jgi:hypothetical protein
MKKAIQQISLLILALSLNLVWANSSFDDIASFQNHITACSECSDSSDPFEYFHSICCEDDVFMNDSKVKSNVSDTENDRVPGLNDNFRNGYLNTIWQPPKSC